MKGTPTGNLAYNCPTCKRHYVVPHDGAYSNITCGGCGRNIVSAVGIYGRVKESKPCDARCTSAKGHECECSCGGKNHGADYS